MSIRTTSGYVQGVLGDDYNGSTPLTAYIRAASLIVDRVETCATAKSKTLTAAELLEIETWLAAHCYVQMDQTYASNSQGGASGSFHGQTGMYLEGSKYGQMAINLDYSGCLVALTGKRQVAGGFWLGKAPSAQTDYVDRD